MVNLTDFEVLDIMAQQNMDIRLSPNLVEVKIVKQGGLVVMGTDPKTAQDLVSNTNGFKVALYIIDATQFEEIKKKGQLFNQSEIKAAEEHCIETLGEKQFLNNKDAVKSISEDFLAGVSWAKKQKPGVPTRASKKKE